MIVGIDLGTTNSLVAVFTEEGPVIIPNRLGKHLTPSVVSVDENGNVYVGETAQERRNLYPDSVAQAFKRSMGTDRTYDLSGKKFRPEELSSIILRYLKEDAEAYLGEGGAYDLGAYRSGGGLRPVRKRKRHQISGI